MKNNVFANKANAMPRGVVALLLVWALTGCSVPIADLPLIGLPANAPPRPQTTGAYPAVHDMPEARAEQVLAPDERARIERELIAARDRQAAGTASEAAKPRK